MHTVGSVTLNITCLIRRIPACHLKGRAISATSDEATYAAIWSSRTRSRSVCRALECRGSPSKADCSTATVPAIFEERHMRHSHFFGVGIGLALLLGLTSLAAAAPPANCVNKFVGTWSVTVNATGQTYRSQIRANGTLTSACPGCPPVQTWTCSGNTFILTSPVSVTHTISSDGRRMAGGCCSLVRIGGAPVAAKGPDAPKDRFPDPPILPPAQAAKCPLPPNAKEATEKFIQEHAGWIDNPRSNEERAKALNNRANAFFSYRRFDLAIKDREAERALTGKVFCGRCLAQAYLANGQHDRAIEEFKSISVARPEQEREYACYLGMAYHQKGEYERAIKAYNEATLVKDDGLTDWKNCGLFGRGLTKVKMGDATGQQDMAAAEAADSKVKHPIKYEQFFCMHGLIAETTIVAQPRPLQDVKSAAEPDKTEFFERLISWQARMKETNIPFAAPHLLVAPPCASCSPAGFYCTTPVLSVSDLKGKRVALGADERELGQQLSSAGALIVSLPPADTRAALERGIADCVGGAR